jgi:hypothetical protein
MTFEANVQALPSPIWNLRLGVRFKMLATPHRARTMRSPSAGSCARQPKFTATDFVSV